MSTSSPRPTLVVIARGDQELGSWPESEVRRGLAEGRLQASDYFWREGQTEWLPLTEFARDQPPPPAPSQPHVFAIRFGSAWAVDKFGFVRKGELSCTPDTIELRGMRHWPMAARAGLWFVAWILLALALSVLGHGDSREAGALVNLLRAYSGLMALLGAPFLAAMLTHYLCASPSSLSLAKSQLSAVVRRGVQISFSAPAPGSAKPFTGLFRAESEAVAGEIEKQLRSFD